MKRVIYAWNYLEWGGAQIHIIALIKEVKKQFDVIVVLPAGSDPQFISFLDSLNIPYRFFDRHADLSQSGGILRKIGRHWNKICSEREMLRTIESVRTKDSVVHVDLLPNQSLFSLVWLCLRTHVFITSHNAMPAVQNWRYLLWKVKFGLISRFDSFHVFCSNEDAARYFRRLYTGRVADEIEVTYTSVDPTEIEQVIGSDFDRSDALGRFGIADEKFVVLSLGQFIDRKGRWDFLAAADRLRELSDIQFVWIGPNPPDEETTKRIESYGLGSSFLFIHSADVGPDHIDVLRFLRVADVFALPSHVEGLPIALLEAMALGIPSISTRINGIPEAILDHVTGLLVEAGDADGLADAIKLLHSDKDLRSKLSVAGNQIAVTKFDERLAARTALAAYRRVLDSTE